MCGGGPSAVAGVLDPWGNLPYAVSLAAERGPSSRLRAPGLHGFIQRFCGVAGPVQRPSRFCHQTPHQGIQGTTAKAVIGGL